VTTLGSSIQPSIALLTILAAALGPAPPALGQVSPVHKTTLQDVPFPPPKHHSVTVRTVIDPGGETPRHMHPGVEMGYVLSGEALLTIAGQTPRSLAAGDAFSIPAYTPHSVRNTGAGPLTMLSTYVIDKAKPIVIPAP
jgi:quercetin dioxygenase-like cupin family protein